jgi:thiosulfate dehydrogenase
MAGRPTGSVVLVVLAVVAAAIGVGAGYFLWGWHKDPYKIADPARLPASPENDLIKLGQDIVVNTATHIGPLAADETMRFAGNQLACTNCHLNAGLQAFAAPYVSSFASFPMMVSDKVETLADRLNGCMTNSLNGKKMPVDSKAMNALIAYIRYVGTGSPQGVRIPGMGLMPMAPAAETPDAARGQVVFTEVCARCHGADGQGQLKTTANSGYSIPPLWGDQSFNAAAGMADINMAAAFIRANMPRGITWRQPILTDQQAWDVAAFVTTQPRPPAPVSGD